MTLRGYSCVRGAGSCDSKRGGFGVSWSGAIMGPEELGLLLMWLGCDVSWVPAT
jgi:hypothetical protein